MSKDPLDLLGDLPDWPGNRPPKNRPNSKKHIEIDDRFNGAKGKTFRVGGEEKHFFTIGELAKALNRQPVTIRMWESRGWIPKATFRTPPPKRGTLPGKPVKGRRLYSLEQVEFLMDALQRFNLDDPVQANWGGFKKHIKDNWPNT
jgi:hypothetical protein